MSQRFQTTPVWQHTCLALTIVGILSGCHTTGDAPADISNTPVQIADANAPGAQTIISADQYHQVIEATRYVLRKQNLPVARLDQRLGIIESHWQIVPTAIEFWRPGHAQKPYSLDSSVQELRQRTRITLAPVSDEPNSDWEFAIQVEIQWYSRPQREAIVSMSRNTNDVRSDTSPDNRWLPWATRPELARKTLQDILGELK